MTVKRILESRPSIAPASIAPDGTVSEALGLLASNNVSALVVTVDGGTIEGIVTERDIVRGLHRLGAELLDHPVSEIMTPKVITCVTSDSAAGITAIMLSRKIRHVPVVENDKFVGMVSIRDLLQLRLTEVQSEAEAMRDYIAGAGQGPA